MMRDHIISAPAERREAGEWSRRAKLAMFVFLACASWGLVYAAGKAAGWWG